MLPAQGRHARSNAGLMLARTVSLTHHGDDLILGYEIPKFDELGQPNVYVPFTDAARRLCLPVYL